MTERHQVRVKAITLEAEGIHTFVLVPLPGQELPPFTPGSHIDVHMRSGLVRSYSLVNGCARTATATCWGWRAAPAAVAARATCLMKCEWARP